MLKLPLQENKTKQNKILKHGFILHCIIKAHFPLSECYISLKQPRAKRYTEMHRKIAILKIITVLTNKQHPVNTLTLEVCATPHSKCNQPQAGRVCYNSPINNAQVIHKTPSPTQLQNMQIGAEEAAKMQIRIAGGSSPNKSPSSTAV